MESTPICCGTFEKYARTFNWMSYYDEDKDTNIAVMPYIPDEFGNKWRVNNCPTCGAEVRGVQLTEEQFNLLP